MTRLLSIIQNHLSEEYNGRRDLFRIKGKNP